MDADGDETGFGGIRVRRRASESCDTGGAFPPVCFFTAPADGGRVLLHQGA